MRKLSLAQIKASASVHNVMTKTGLGTVACHRLFDLAANAGMEASDLSVLSVSSTYQSVI